MNVSGNILHRNRVKPVGAKDGGQTRADAFCCDDFLELLDFKVADQNSCAREETDYLPGPKHDLSDRLMFNSCGHCLHREE